MTLNTSANFNTSNASTSVLKQVKLLGTGRRKCAVARVQLIKGKGRLLINGTGGRVYLQDNPAYLQAVKAPLFALAKENRHDIVARVRGGGLSAQAQAISLGVARALCKIQADNRRPLKRQGLLRRDPRVKERKKYGLKKARKSSQFSKR
uniref:Small ribosomal subunit protein uS9c n=1 Tax=Klebsormidium flaccidum TaxID=3175 RepID=A0A024B318_KLEFL|nr:ribosomal protein S9 [Klebsormidium flaccidum]AHZ11004.1 ribosomal protein S9 [Klebsormidium flaccidum]